MGSTTLTRGARVAAAGLLAAVSAAGVGYVTGHLGELTERRVLATDDTYVLVGHPDLTNGARPELVAGGLDGDAAIVLVKFKVRALPAGRAPVTAQIRLARAAGTPPSTVELSRVGSGWTESTVTARTAPRLGAVVAMARPRHGDSTIAFDVRSEITAPGTYAFAVTVPAGSPPLLVPAKERDSAPALVLGWRAEAVPSIVVPTVPPIDLPPIVAPLVPPIDLPPIVVPPVPPVPPIDLPPVPGLPSLPPLPPLPPLPSLPPDLPLPPVTPPITTPPIDPPEPPTARCAVGEKLVPTCGVLWGVAPGAHTPTPRAQALREFEAKTGRPQAIYHAYHRGTGQLFPTPEEIALAREPGRERLLFLNWKPTGNWAEIAAGRDRATNGYLDRVAAHISQNFPEPFFLTVYHEAEDNVRAWPGSGYTASDYADMYRYVVERLRAGGATNAVSVLVHMAYPPWNAKPWWTEMYPGDDVVDWVAFDSYAYSDPGYGHGDFAELVNRRWSGAPNWPGFYDWAADRYPQKPLMVAEWGVWHSDRNPDHKPWFYRNVGQQIELFPRIKAMVHFDTPSDQRQLDSRVDSTAEALTAYRELGALDVFNVDLRPAVGRANPPHPGT